MRDHWITDRPPSERFPAYTRFNAGEVLAGPVSPLGWTTVWEQGICRGNRAGCIEIGMLNDWELDAGPPEPFGCWGGYFYNPLSSLRLFGLRLPGGSWDMVEKAYFGDDPSIPPFIEEPWHRNADNTALLARQLERFLSVTSLPEYDREREVADRLRAERPAFDSLSTSELISRSRSLLGHLRSMFKTEVVAGLAASVGSGGLLDLLSPVGREDLALEAISGLGEVDTAGIALGLWDLSRLTRADTALADQLDALIASDESCLGAALTDGELASGLRAFLAEFGCRGTDEWEVRSYSWEERPSIVLRHIQRLQALPDDMSPHRKHAEQARARRRALDQACSILGEQAREELTTSQRVADLYLSARERNKHSLMIVVNEIRVLYREIGRRGVADGHLAHVDHIFMLLASELDDFAERPETYGQLLATREVAWTQLADLEPPIVINGAMPPLSQWKRRAPSHSAPLAEGDVLRGKAGSPGRVIGRVRVIGHPGQGDDLGPGDVLAAYSVDPSWTPLFVVSGAVVTSVGALGSHAVITSRELGIPCVVGLAEEFGRLTNGTLLEVDGSAGTVTVIESASS